jgi:hypothetical protein
MGLEITYERAIEMILRGSRGKTFDLVLSYFDTSDQENAARTLDEMRTDGRVSFDGTFYRLPKTHA